MGILNLNRKHKIEVEGYEFDIQIPTPGQIADIDIKVSKWMDGAKIESFPASTYEYLQMVQTLNTVITSYPPELSKLKSWSEIDDFEFLEGVYFAYLEKKKLFDEELKKIETIEELYRTETLLDLYLMKNFHILPKGVSNLSDLELKQKMFLLEADSWLDMDKIKRRVAWSKHLQMEESKPASQFMPESIRKALRAEGFSEAYLEESAQKIKANKIQDLKKEMEKL